MRCEHWRNGSCGKATCDCVDGPPADPSPKLWCVHIEGPDDIAAAEDKEVAEAVALLMNRAFVRHGWQDEMKAQAVVWPSTDGAWTASSADRFHDLREMLAEVGIT